MNDPVHRPPKALNLPALALAAAVGSAFPMALSGSLFEPHAGAAFCASFAAFLAGGYLARFARPFLGFASGTALALLAAAAAAILGPSSFSPLETHPFSEVQTELLFRFFATAGLCVLFMDLAGAFLGPRLPTPARTIPDHDQKGR